jgi:hypothetical protein
MSYRRRTLAVGSTVHGQPRGLGQQRGDVAPWYRGAAYSFAGPTALPLTGSGAPSTRTPQRRPTRRGRRVPPWSPTDRCRPRRRPHCRRPTAPRRHRPARPRCPIARPGAAPCESHPRAYRQSKSRESRHRTLAVRKSSTKRTLRMPRLFSRRPASPVLGAGGRPSVPGLGTGGSTPAAVCDKRSNSGGWQSRCRCTATCAPACVHAWRSRQGTRARSHQRAQLTRRVCTVC